MSLLQFSPASARPTQSSMQNYLKTKCLAAIIILGLMQAALLADTGTPDLITNGNFQGGQDHWTLFKNGSANATLSFPHAASDGKVAACIAVAFDNAAGELWFVAFRQEGISLVQGKSYQLSFQMKASQGTSAFVTLVKNTSPWGKIPGIDGKQLGVSDQWQTFSYQFVAQGSEDNARLNFTNLYKPGVTWYFSNVSLLEVPSK
jgi:hypothetical protein